MKTPYSLTSNAALYLSDINSGYIANKGTKETNKLTQRIKIIEIMNKNHLLVTYNYSTLRISDFDFLFEDKNYCYN